MRYARAMAIGLALALAGCGDKPASTVSGYVEGDYVYVAAPEAGWVTEVLVTRGGQVQVGDPLFALDADAQVAARKQAAAGLEQAEAQLANLQKGQRVEQIAALEAALLQAKANRDLADADLKRTTDLRDRGFVSQAAYDTNLARRNANAEQVKQAEANLALARKGARVDEITAAQANVAAAKAALERADYALSQRRIRSKVAARVEDTLRRTGEFVSAGGAVVQLLPPANIKVRFFVPEETRAKLKVGGTVGLSCDGCAKNLSGHISFIAAQAEYTPPVIYSVGSREKLVWMVEAVPTAGAFSPGQPIDVALP